MQCSVCRINHTHGHRLLCSFACIWNITTKRRTYLANCNFLYLQNTMIIAIKHYNKSTKTKKKKHCECKATSNGGKSQLPQFEFITYRYQYNQASMQEAVWSGGGVCQSDLSVLIISFLTHSGVRKFWYPPPSSNHMMSVGERPCIEPKQKIRCSNCENQR